MTYASNPILSGFYPVPSICRVGEDFYLVNSSFAYFPGVPIWHSKNLADWIQIGNVLDRISQLPLEDSKHSGGIYAPTIRYHEGNYYMITTNVSGGGNFIVTAMDPKGPWSEPYYLGEEAQGIDPSLFFDEDGTCYYVGTRPNPAGVRYNGDWEIWVQKLDLVNMRLWGESFAVWKGALKEVIWPEGPHLYRKDGYYYLMIAEGGTGPNHAVTVARSKNVFGPYENNPNNPILTHRHLGKDYPVIYVGHGDLIDDEAGNWYMVMLASRRCEGFVGLGRETFLAKVIWEDGWPVVNPGAGKLERVVDLPFQAERNEKIKVQSMVDNNENKHDIIMLRNPREPFFQYSNNNLMVNFLPETLKDLKSPAYLGFRQLDYNYEAELEMEFDRLAPEEETGLVILQSNEFHMRFYLKRSNWVDKAEEGFLLQIIKCTHAEDKLLSEKVLPAKELIQESGKYGINLKMKGHGQKADFILMKGQREIPVLANTDIHEMSTEIAGGFVGNTIGVYASSCGSSSDNCVIIQKFIINY